MKVCPTDVVLAPAERIWHLLTDPRELAQWTGMKLVEGPAGPMSEGDHGMAQLFIELAYDAADGAMPEIIPFAEAA